MQDDLIALLRKATYTSDPTSLVIPYCRARSAESLKTLYYIIGFLESFTIYETESMSMEWATRVLAADCFFAYRGNDDVVEMLINGVSHWPSQAERRDYELTGKGRMPLTADSLRLSIRALGATGAARAAMTIAAVALTGPAQYDDFRQPEQRLNEHLKMISERNRLVRQGADGWPGHPFDHAYFDKLYNFARSALLKIRRNPVPSDAFGLADEAATLFLACYLTTDIERFAGSSSRLIDEVIEQPDAKYFIANVIRKEEELADRLNLRNYKPQGRRLWTGH